MSVEMACGVSIPLFLLGCMLNAGFRPRKPEAASSKQNAQGASMNRKFSTIFDDVARDMQTSVGGSSNRRLSSRDRALRDTFGMEVQTESAMSPDAVAFWGVGSLHTCCLLFHALLMESWIDMVIILVLPSALFAILASVMLLQVLDRFVFPRVARKPQPRTGAFRNMHNTVLRYLATSACFPPQTRVKLRTLEGFIFLLLKLVLWLVLWSLYLVALIIVCPIALLPHSGLLASASANSGRWLAIFAFLLFAMPPLVICVVLGITLLMVPLYATRLCAHPALIPCWSQMRHVTRTLEALSSVVFLAICQHADNTSDLAFGAYTAARVFCAYSIIRCVYNFGVETLRVAEDLSADQGRAAPIMPVSSQLGTASKLLEQCGERRHTEIAHYAEATEGNCARDRGPAIVSPQRISNGDCDTYQTQRLAAGDTFVAENSAGNLHQGRDDARHEFDGADTLSSETSYSQGAVGRSCDGAGYQHKSPTADFADGGSDASAQITPAANYRYLRQGRAGSGADEDLDLRINSNRKNGADAQVGGAQVGRDSRNAAFRSGRSSRVRDGDDARSCGAGDSESSVGASITPDPDGQAISPDRRSPAAAAFARGVGPKHEGSLAPDRRAGACEGTTDSCPSEYGAVDRAQSNRARRDDGDIRCAGSPGCARGADRQGGDSAGRRDRAAACNISSETTVRAHRAKSNEGALVDCVALELPDDSDRSEADSSDTCSAVGGVARVVAAGNCAQFGEYSPPLRRGETSRPPVRGKEYIDESDGTDGGPVAYHYGYDGDPHFAYVVPGDLSDHGPGQQPAFQLDSGMHCHTETAIGAGADVLDWMPNSQLAEVRDATIAQLDGAMRQLRDSFNKQDSAVVLNHQDCNSIVWAFDARGARIHDFLSDVHGLDIGMRLCAIDGVDVGINKSEIQEQWQSSFRRTRVTAQMSLRFTR